MKTSLPYNDEVAPIAIAESKLVGAKLRPGLEIDLAVYQDDLGNWEPRLVVFVDEIDTPFDEIVVFTKPFDSMLEKSNHRFEHYTIGLEFAAEFGMVALEIALGHFLVLELESLTVVRRLTQAFPSTILVEAYFPFGDLGMKLTEEEAARFLEDIVEES